nr:unnamed protein product [Digitaria exilis]
MTDSGADIAQISLALATRIRNWRKEKKLSLDELSRRASVSKGMLVEIEKGAANPSIAILCKLAAALGVSVADIVNVSSEPRVHVIEEAAIPVLWQGPQGGYARLLAGTSGPDMIELWQWGSQGGTTDLTEEGPSFDSTNSTNGKGLARMETMVAAFKEAILIGPDNEKSKILKMISNEDNKQFEVISICGMGGVGKTTLVKCVYQSQELNAMFNKRACVTIKRPFNAITPRALAISPPDDPVADAHRTPDACTAMPWMEFPRPPVTCTTTSSWTELLAA